MLRVLGTSPMEVPHTGEPVGSTVARQLRWGSGMGPYRRDRLYSLVSDTVFEVEGRGRTPRPAQ